MSEPLILNQTDAADKLGVSLSKFKKLEREGVIKRLERIGAYYSVECLEDLLNGGTNEPDN